MAEIHREGYQCTLKKGCGWLVVLGLTALLGTISVNIGLSPRERVKDKKMIDKENK